MEESQPDGRLPRMRPGNAMARKTAGRERYPHRETLGSDTRSIPAGVGGRYAGSGKGLVRGDTRTGKRYRVSLAERSDTRPAVPLGRVSTARRYRQTAPYEAPNTYAATRRENRRVAKKTRNLCILQNLCTVQGQPFTPKLNEIPRKHPSDDSKTVGRQHVASINI